MSLSVWPDWLRIVVFMTLWAMVGAFALDTFPGEGEAAAICVGWVVSYIALMGTIALGQKDGGAMARAFFMSLGVMTVISYTIGIMLGVDGGTP